MKTAGPFSCPFSGMTRPLFHPLQAPFYGPCFHRPAKNLAGFSSGFFTGKTIGKAFCGFSRFAFRAICELLSFFLFLLYIIRNLILYYLFSCIKGGIGRFWHPYGETKSSRCHDDPRGEKQNPRVLGENPRIPPPVTKRQGKATIPELVPIRAF